MATSVNEIDASVEVGMNQLTEQQPLNQRIFPGVVKKKKKIIKLIAPNNHSRRLTENDDDRTRCVTR